MSKMIRLSDETYQLLRAYADHEGRSISNAGDWLIRSQFEVTPDAELLEEDESE